METLPQIPLICLIICVNNCNKHYSNHMWHFFKSLSNLRVKKIELFFLSALLNSIFQSHPQICSRTHLATVAASHAHTPTCISCPSHRSPFSNLPPTPCYYDPDPSSSRHPLLTQGLLLPGQVGWRWTHSLSTAPEIQSSSLSPSSVAENTL